jgi:hypothetical protein
MKFYKIKQSNQWGVVSYEANGLDISSLCGQVVTIKKAGHEEPISGVLVDKRHSRTVGDHGHMYQVVSSKLFLEIKSYGYLATVEIDKDTEIDLDHYYTTIGDNNE